MSAEDLTVFRAPDDKIRPGDIVRFSPTLKSLRESVYVGGEQNGKKGRTATLVTSEELSHNVVTGKKATKVVIPATLAWGVLLTRGCDIDKGRDRQVAFLRPLAHFADQDTQIAIMDGRHTSLHYLPPVSSGDVELSDTVIDFRFILTISPKLFDKLERPVSLTREAVLDVYLGWLRHTVGHHIPRTIPCADCGCEVPVLQAVVDVANPPADY